MLTPSRLRRALLAASLALLASGGAVSCSNALRSPLAPSAASPETNPAGDIPDNQAYVTFTSPSGAYSLKVPEGWSQTGEGSSVSFSSRYNSLRVETRQTAEPPTVASAKSTEVPSLGSSTPGFSLQEVSSVHRSAGDAVLVRYQLRSPPDPVTGKVVQLAAERYEFWRGGLEAVLTLSAPVGADNADPWRTITDSFGWR